MRPVVGADYVESLGELVAGIGHLSGRFRPHGSLGRAAQMGRRNEANGATEIAVAEFAVVE